MENYDPKHAPPSGFQLFITSDDESTRVNVRMNKSPYRKSYSLTKGEMLAVDIPESAEVKGSNTSHHSILIQAENDISVVLVYRKMYSVGTMTVYPTQELGTEYYVVTPSGSESTKYLKEFAVIGGKVPTTVDIYLKAAVSFNGRSHPAGRILRVSLEALEVIQLQSLGDLSGTMIRSVNPVAVLSGHICVLENSYCDHVVEQLLPVSGWGTSFIVPPIFFQTNSDIAYVVAAQNTHIEYQQGTRKRFLDLVAGEVRTFDVRFPHALYISADAGIQVLFFFTGINSRKKVFDPFLINIPAMTSYGQSYHVDEISNFENSVVLIAKRSATLSITRDKLPIHGIQWRGVPGTLYSWGTYNLEAGAQSLSLEHPETPFGVLVFGGREYEGYGFAPPPLSSSGPESTAMPCPENSHYEICGNGCPATCSDRMAPLTFNGVRGCHTSSHFTCIGTGDPHYTSFDGKKFDFMGTCIYQMAAVCSKDPALTPFLVTVQNNNRGSKAVSYTKVVTLEVYGMTISLSQEYPRKIQVNGVFVDLPFSYENKLKVYISGVHGFIKTDFDLRVSFDWYSYARVIMPMRSVDSAAMPIRIPEMTSP
ncbi:UNVERIFIED_CONTAM: hypothetical protein K2H54_040286 [Gekko kuhli]